MRVQVWDGAGKEDLGRGSYTGDVSIYCFHMPDGSIKSMTNPEEKPPSELIAEIESIGGDLAIFPKNPKIELDNGTIVYGCQVWWQHCGDEKGE